MQRLLLLFCLMAVSMPTTALSPLPPDKFPPAPPPTTCAALSCVKGQECRFVMEDIHIAPRCLDFKEIPRGGGSDACGKTGHPLLIAEETEQGTKYVVFRCKDICPTLNFLFVHGVCCAGVGICQLPKVPGPCRGYLPRYYYDSGQKKCLGFVYGGCGGNKNNFKTLDECQKACHKSVCQLPKVPGPCRGYFPRYYYDSGKKKCLGFVYGGCGGNKNNFKTLDECQKACHKTPPPPVGSCPPVIPTRPGVCAFSCNFDSDCKPGDKCCRTACGGRTCVRPVVTKPPGCAAITCLKGTECIEDEAGARCKPIVTVGRCPPPGRFGTCAFTCSGDSSCGKGKKCCKTACGGTTCKTAIPLPTCAATTCEEGTKCVEDDTKGARCEPIGICQLPREVGPCRARFRRYYYDSKKEQCHRFYYGGCRGNKNNFKSKVACEKACQKLDADICQLPREVGPCRARFRRYYYDSKKEQCRRFYYGGCRGNKNNFKSKVACEKACQKPSVGICPPALPSPPGTCGKPCKEDRQCKKGEKCCKTGCGHKGCRSTVKPPTCASTLCLVGTICKETPEGAKCIKVKPGICPGIQKKKTCGQKCKYDKDCSKSQKCCNVGCKSNTCVDPLPPCAVVRCGQGQVCINTPTGAKCVPAGPRPGQCPQIKCAPFPPKCVHKCKHDSECPKGRKCCRSCTGCKDCLPSSAPDPCATKICKKGEKCKLQVVQCIRAPCPPIPECVPADKCVLPKDPGPCKAAITRYYYNSANGKCSEFTYGGCKGNGNRFDSRDDCKKACSEHICKLPRITGMCRAYIPSFFYNTKTGKCERFIYGGCQGNDNRFPSEKACQDVCKPEK